MSEYHAQRAQTIEPFKQAARELLQQRSGLSVRQVAAQVNLSYSVVFNLAHAIDCVPHKTRERKPRVRRAPTPKSQHRVVAERQRNAILVDARVVDQHTRESSAQRSLSARKRDAAQSRINGNGYLQAITLKRIAGKNKSH